MSSLSRELVFLILQFLEEEKFKEFVHKENDQLSKYGDTKVARTIMLVELKKLIESNPLFRDKLVFPTLNSSRLRTLINQSMRPVNYIYAVQEKNQAAVVTASSIPVPQNQVPVLKLSRTPPANPGMVDYQSPDHEQLMK